MEITEEKLDSEIYKINLSGRMDIEGVSDIETEFVRMAASPRLSIIVDMSGVPYMSSIGIRALLMNGKSVTGRGGKYAVLNPQADVREVLEISGIDMLLDICDGLDEAIAKVTA